MRRYIAALDYSDLSRLIEKVSDCFAHGGPGFQLYLYDQREIGERLMLASKHESEAPIFRYSDFRDMMRTSTLPDCLRALRRGSKYFLENVDSESKRAAAIQNALIDLLDFIDPDYRWVQPERRKKFSVESQHAAKRN